MSEAKVLHLGDGAYATVTEYEVLITANHHDPVMASDKVYLEPEAMEQLVQVCRDQGYKFGND